MAKTDNFCESCTYWSQTYPDGDKSFGACSNMNVTDSVRVSQDYDSIEDDGTGIFTEALFGCIYHEAKDRNVVAVIRLPKKN